MSNDEEEERQHLVTLDELEETQAQIKSYQGLLKDLPVIFERKFNERLQPHLDRQQQLLDEREQLLCQLHQHLPPVVGADARLIFTSSAPPPVATADKTNANQSPIRLWLILGLAALGGCIGLGLAQHFAPRKSTHSSSIIAPSPSNSVPNQAG